jgi:hypothetical protein
MKKIISVLAILVVGIGLMYALPVKAATITQAATGNVSSDSYGAGASVALPYISITESATTDIAVGTHVWIIPTGYVFDTTSVPDVIYAGTGLTGSTTATMAATTMTITTTASSTATSTNSMKIGSVTPIKVRVSAGCPQASAGNITMTGGTITGLSGSSNFGTLTQVPGAMTKLVVVLPGQSAPNCAAPSGTVTAQIAGTSFNITNLYATDQYFNTTTYSGAKTISYTGPGSCAGVNPSYTTSVSFTSGISTTPLATTLVLAQVTTITASDSATTGPASSNLTVNPASITTLACSSSASPGTVWLTWTEAAGCTTGYDVRYLTSNIADDTDFGNATVFSQTWAGANPQALRQELVTGLTPNIRYYFNQKAKGANTTLSTISNTVNCIAPSQAAATLDTKAPTSSITDPKDGATILAGKPYTIKGISADTGGSSVQKVELSLDGGTTWLTVSPKTTNTTAGFDWEYLWQSPAFGIYTLKTRATDWVSNIETPGAGINVKVITELPTVKPPTVEKPISEMTVEELKTKITEIQQKIIELLNQLIQLIQDQITELQTK